MSKKKKILIVEDEVIIAMEIKSYLEKIGYIVTSINHNYNSAIKSFKKELPDVVLLDIYLSEEKTGIDVADEISKIQVTPIIFISAYSSTPYISKASEHNTCTYLVKPIKREELKINIELALSKSRLLVDTERNVYLYEDCYFDSVNMILYENNETVLLSINEKKLLSFFIHNKDEVIYLSEIKEVVWGAEKPANNSVRNLIYRLRKKLRNPDCIETVLNEGWRLKLLPLGLDL